jgi:hypothetical protein
VRAVEAERCPNRTSDAIRDDAVCPIAMTRIGAVIALIIVLVVVWLARRPDQAVAAASGATHRGSSPTSIAPRPVKRLATRDQDRAHDVHGAATTPFAWGSPRRTGGVEDEPPLLDVDDATAALHDAMPAVMPHLRDCYERARADLARPDVTAEIDLTLVGDPAIGTMVEADVRLDPGQRLPGALVDCLRSELQLLALPPLPTGDRITVTYPFAFSPGPLPN